MELAKPDAVRRAVGRRRGLWLVRARGTQTSGGARVTSQQREFERRLTLAVGRLEVRAQLDEQVQDVRSASRDRELQGVSP